MTERQAWLKLAKMWDKAYIDSDGDYSAMGTASMGLCPCITLDIADDLDQGVSVSMLGKIKKLPKITHYGLEFVWRTDKASAEARAAFCRKQAALLAKRKPK